MPEVTDSITGEVVPGAMETVDVDVFRQRLATAYAQALKLSHAGGSVQIHMGADVVEYLRSLCTVPDPSVVSTTCWGYPVIEADERLPADHISVHSVYHIF